MSRPSKSWMHAGLLMVIAALLLAACSGGGGGAKQPADSTGTDKPSTAKPSDEGNSGEDLKPFTIKFFDQNTGDKFNNPVAQVITERTGVTVEIQQPTGNPSEKLNLMLASNDLPDVILTGRGSDIVDKYIAAGAFIPLDDLIEEHGPNIKKMYGEMLNKIRHSDGKNYYLSNWYGLDADPVFGFMMRKDVLKELGAVAKADNGEPFSAEEFKDLLVAFKAKYPTIDGKPSVPLTMNGENMGAVMGTFKGMYGMKSYYKTDNDELKLDVRDPRYLDMVKYMNNLFTEGLVDTEWAINKNQLFEQKTSSGTVFASVGAYWDFGNANNLLKEAAADPANKEESQFYSYKVVGPGIDPSQTTFGPRSSLGWDAIAITRANSDPVRTIKFIDFLASEEGQYLLMWGVEGKHWDMVDGKRVPKPETMEGLQADWTEFTKNEGVRKWTWFIKNGMGSDGSPYDMATKYERDPVSALALKNLEDSVWDTSPYDNLGPDGGTPEALIQQKVKDLMDNHFPKMVMAGSEAEVEQVYNTLVSELDKAGADKLEQIYTANYKERLSLWQ
ncbi:extracellular solute-binding protein [Paenibacillaceae bacterium]|nr:extracellular solute-binding protein [Paenibacillaceae bacterium]